MQTTSALYDSIIVGADHWFETQLVIDDVGTFSENQLFSISTNVQMFQNSPTLGKAVAGEIEIKMFKPSVDIPIMACLRPQVRVCNATQQSEWLSQGVYFIDTRETSANMDGLDILTIHGYDAMLKSEQVFQSDVITGDSVDTDMVDEIASIMGVSVDARTYTLMTQGYTIPLPTGYSCREVLGYIASMYVGCFVMSDVGELRLVTILELPAETNLLITEGGVPLQFGDDCILLQAGVS